MSDNNAAVLYRNRSGKSRAGSADLLGLERGALSLEKVDIELVAPAGISRTCSPESPKRSREFESIEDRLVLLASAGAPIGGEAIVPPGVGQLAQLQHGDARSWGASTKPSGNVLFRPEEIHIASSEDDVFPPRGRRDQAMEAHRLIAGSLASDRYR